MTARWEERRAATLVVGQVTPAGEIVAVDYFGALRLVTIGLADGRTFERGFDELVSVETRRAPICACSHYADGSTYRGNCPAHSDRDPCLTMSLVTGRRRKGTIRNGVCSHCGHGAPT